MKIFVQFSFHFNILVPVKFSAWILVWRVAKTWELSKEAHWQVSEDPYHTEFVLWRLDHYPLSIFCANGGGMVRLIKNKCTISFFTLPEGLKMIFWLTFSRIRYLLNPPAHHSFEEDIVFFPKNLHKKFLLLFNYLFFTSYWMFTFDS